MEYGGELLSVVPERTLDVSLPISSNAVYNRWTYEDVYD
jgi:hypothetical protein